MGSGEAVITLTPPADCPLFGVSDQFEGGIDLLSWSASITDDGSELQEQLTIGVDESAKGNGREDLHSVKSRHESIHTFEFSLPEVESLHQLVETILSHEVNRVRIQDGDIQMNFAVQDGEEVSDILNGLQQQYRSVALDRTQGLETDNLQQRIDLTGLTDRQQKVVQKAFEMGYFEYPKKSNATEVAAELGISRSTFSEHLSAAQMKIGSQVFLTE